MHGNYTPIAYTHDDYLYCPSHAKARGLPNQPGTGAIPPWEHATITHTVCADCRTESNDLCVNLGGEHPIA
jgi:hypothetical protein